MSLAIDVDRVSQVLLSDGKWHKVKGKSFDLDAYEFMHEERRILTGGMVEGVPSLGATWQEPDGSLVVCPLTAVLALRLYPQKAKTKRA